MRSRRPASPLRGLLLFLLGGLVGANATYFAMSRNANPIERAAIDRAEHGNAAAPSANTGDPPPAEPNDAASSQHDSGPILRPPVPSMRGAPTDIADDPSMPATVAGAQGSGLLIPVQGITASQLSDTFTEARSAGRLHDAIDIMAPAGTPVLAVADGHVEKLFNSKPGGLTIYEFNRDGTLAYYYAHLQRYADGLSEKQPITRGQVIGYVGATGNANPDAPHLHFAIFQLGPEKQWWKGEPRNPYPQLAPAGGKPH